MGAKYNVYLSTNKGLVRSDNEDNYAINTVVRNLNDKEKNIRGLNGEQPLVCSVFDGMGGEAHGDLASKIAADCAVRLYKRLKNGTDSITKEIFSFVRESNDAIVTTIGSDDSSRGGSTFVSVVINRDIVYPFSLGDSRLYLYRNGTLTQITNDHTLAMKKYRANIYTLEEALSSSDSHKLTSFLGLDLGDGVLEPEVYTPFVLENNEKLLLCSDGLYDMCSDDEILQIMSSKSKTISLRLVDKAIENGGVDNVTCMVIERSEQ